jgi:hypothetical protein
MASSKNRNVCRPCKTFSVVARELCFHDDAKHGFAVDEQHHGISAEFGWHDLRQI